MGALFTESTLGFLTEAPLRDRAWFHTNRTLYQDDVAEPQRRLADEAQAGMAALEPAHREHGFTHLPGHALCQGLAPAGKHMDLCA